MSLNYETYKMENISGSQFENGINIMQNSIAPHFEVEAIYKTGDYVIYNGLLYMCIDDDFIPGEWDETQWEQHRIFDNKEVVFNSGGSRYVTVPFVENPVIYNGEIQTPVFKYYEINKLAISGQTSGIVAGNYSVVFTLKDGYIWDDDTTAPKTVVWSIQKRKISMPVFDTTEFTYSGSSQGPVITYDNVWSTLSGTTTAITSGTYTVTFTLNDTVNTTWVDDTISSLTRNWTINRAIKLAPTELSVSAKGDGKEHTNGYTKPEGVSMSGTDRATEPGTYTATYTIDDTINYQWSTGGIQPITVTLTIVEVQFIDLNQFRLSDFGENINTIIVMDRMIVKSLTVTADDCSGRDTTTTIHYQATLELIHEDGSSFTVIDSGMTVSSSFEQNTSRTDSIVRTVDVTIYGITKSVTFTQGVWKDIDYNIVLSGIGGYGFEKDTSILTLDQTIYDGPYKSLNYNISSSQAVAKINTFGYTSFTVWINSYAESGYDYTIASTLNAASYPTSNSDSTALQNTASFQYDPSTGLTESNWKKVTYTLTEPTNYIYIVYRKDSGDNRNHDRGYFVIERG